MDGGEWERALKLAEDTGDDGLIQHVKAAYAKHLKGNTDADAGGALAQLDVVAGLDMLVQNGHWEQCIAEAAKHGGQVRRLWDDGRVIVACDCGV